MANDTNIEHDKAALIYAEKVVIAQTSAKLAADSTGIQFNMVSRLPEVKDGFEITSDGATNAYAKVALKEESQGATVQVFSDKEMKNQITSYDFIGQHGKLDLDVMQGAEVCSSDKQPWKYFSLDAQGSPPKESAVYRFWSSADNYETGMNVTTIPNPTFTRAMVNIAINKQQVNLPRPGEIYMFPKCP